MFLVKKLLLFGTIRLALVILLRINTLFEDFSITYVLFTLPLRVFWGDYVKIGFLFVALLSVMLLS